MELKEAIAPGGKELAQVKKIADQASKVIISGIDKISSKTNMADEFQYYSMVKIMLDKRFEQILVKALRHLAKANHIHEKRIVVSSVIYCQAKL